MSTLLPTTSTYSIVQEVCASCQPADCDIAGFAAFPAQHGSTLDGIVLEARLWQSCEARKSIIHELGHYLNLYHTFEGGCRNDDCLRQGDRVCDTPPDEDATYFPINPCLQDSAYNSCSTDVNTGDPNNPFSTDQLDPSNNFMDYVPVGCAHAICPQRPALASYKAEAVSPFVARLLH